MSQMRIGTQIGGKLIELSPLGGLIKGQKHVSYFSINIF